MENNLKIEGYELLNQKVYRVLKGAIIKGFLEPGTKLLENKIAEKMHVSRTPLRIVAPIVRKTNNVLVARRQKHTSMQWTQKEGVMFA